MCFKLYKNAFLVLVMSLSAISAQAETVLITGSNQGIGLEFAKQYAARGWIVIATHRRDVPPDTLVALQAEFPLVRIEKNGCHR